jgi:glutathione S-transferase
MPIELWFHHEASAFVRKPLLVAHELDLELEEHRVDFMSEEAMDEYAKINPNRRFPAMRHDDLVLWESNAIMGYLASLHGPQLLGQGEADTARVQQWLFWELAHFGPAMLGLSNLRLGFLPRPARSAEALEQDLGKACRILDAALADSPYLVGRDPTLADMAMITAFTFADEAQLPVNDYANVGAWRERMQSRASWQATEQRKRETLRRAGIE